MIAFTLRCSKAHPFDGWFRGSQDYERQSEAGLLTCPVCGDADISKGLMAPNVSTGRAKENAAREVQQAVLSAKVALEQEARQSADADVPGAGAPGASKRGVDGEVIAGAPSSPNSDQAAPQNRVPADDIAALPSLKDAPAPVKAYVEAVRKLRKEVEAKSDDVGKGFAEEARKMHHGEVEARPIRGQASAQDAAALDEEGIDVFVLPSLPEDGH